MDATIFVLKIGIKSLLALIQCYIPNNFFLQRAGFGVLEIFYLFIIIFCNLKTKVGLNKSRNGKQADLKSIMCNLLKFNEPGCKEEVVMFMCELHGVHC